MGIGGFIPQDDEKDEEDRSLLEVPGGELHVPKSMFGLDPHQMLAMGIAGDSVQRLQRTISEDSLTASNYYVPGHAKISADTKLPTMMRQGNISYRPQQRRQGGMSPPPDLPSLLLDSRIVFIGMPLVASVTELVISELLWLQYHDPNKPVYMYINSLGSQKDFQAIGFETEAYAILDTMHYIRPQVQTLVIGQACGNACMLLAAGQKGKRASLPHARIKMAPPRINRSFGSTVDIMIKANELEGNTDTYMHWMSKNTGQTKEQIYKDCAWDKYFTPEKAIEYGIVDQIVRKGSNAIDAKDYRGAAKQARQQQQRRSGPDDGPQADA